MLPLLLLVVGLVMLGIAGDALVRGAAASARRLRVPPVVLGLTIVAIGTSVPELVVSVQAALTGAAGLAIGNVIGSNIANVLLVLGLPAIVTPVAFMGSGIRRATLFMVAVSVLVVWLVLDSALSSPEGLLLLVLLGVYLFYAGWALHGRTRPDTPLPAADAAARLSPARTVLLVAAGALGLVIGGALTVEGATGVAARLGVSDTVIGLTVVAVGTSLPELAAGLAAAFRREIGLSIGSIVGANIFNALGILGVTAVLLPLEAAAQSVRFDVWVMLAAALVMLPFAFMRRRIGRVEGGLMVLAYLGYLFVVYRAGMVT